MNGGHQHESQGLPAELSCLEEFLDRRLLGCSLLLLAGLGVRKDLLVIDSKDHPNHKQDGQEAEEEEAASAEEGSDKTGEQGRKNGTNLTGDPVEGTDPSHLLGGNDTGHNSNGDTVFAPNSHAC